MRIDTNRLRALVKSHGLTNTDLAAKAGVTRQAVHAMLRKNHAVDVRDRTVKGLAQALRLADGSLLSTDPLMGYKDAVASEHADLTFRGLGLPTTEPRSMDDLYVPIRAIRMPDQERDCQPLAAESEEKPTEESDELTVAQCLSLHRCVLMRGEPGSGKTTMLRHAARAYAQGLAAERRYPKQSRVPLMVRLAEFAKARERDSDMTLVRFVVTRTLPDASSEYWSQVEHYLELELERGACLVLLDGLDEVGGDSWLSTVLRAFVENFDDNQFVLTSRIVGLDAGPWRKLGFATFQVARWREEDIREFARRWFAGRPTSGRKQPKKQVNQRAEEFTKAILIHPSLREIASNPLMVTILAALHHANATLPRRRLDLYAKIVEVMFETWEASKRDAGPGDPLHGIVLEAREFGWLLARLALGMQHEGRILRPRWWVNDSVEQFLRDQMGLDGDKVKEQSERVVRYLCERTGLLVERGDGVFGFYHRTFQEYFAARGLLLQVEGGGDIVALLRPYLFHPQWQEVIVNVAASLPGPRATALLRVILDDPDLAGRFLRRGQRLVLRCLVDGAAVTDRVLFDQIFSDGEAIGGSRWLGTTIEVLSLLKQLLVTRHKDQAERMLSEIEKAVKKLPESDYLAVYLSSHDLPDAPRDAAPGTIYKKRFGSRQIELIWPAWERRIENPDSWYREVLKLIRDRKTDLQRRLALISWLGDGDDANDASERVLKELLVHDPSPAIRVACVGALQDAVSREPTIAKLLLNQLDKDSSDVVRERCAQALGSIAPGQPEVRSRLEELFTSGTEHIRAGAAEGLAGLDLASPEHKNLLEGFLTMIASPREPVEVRRSSICAVESLLGRVEMTAVQSVLERCLDDDHPSVRLVAVRALADSITDGRSKWSEPLVEKIETMLMAVTDPCSHLYADLVMIVARKEIHGGLRMERSLAGALSALRDQIRIAFVFGSVARLEQVRDSDIDLMIVGDVRLKDVAAELHSAEEILGRAVNPVLFSAEKFREQYREGNPLLLDVVRKEKIFLKGSRDELTKLVADGAPG